MKFKLLITCICISLVLWSCTDKDYNDNSKDTASFTNKATMPVSKKVDMFENVELVDGANTDSYSEVEAYVVYPTEFRKLLTPEKNTIWKAFSDKIKNENTAKSYISEIDPSESYFIESASGTRDGIDVKVKFDDKYIKDFLGKNNYEISSYENDYHIPVNELRSLLINECLYSSQITEQSIDLFKSYINDYLKYISNPDIPGFQDVIETAREKSKILENYQIEKTYLLVADDNYSIQNLNVTSREEGYISDNFDSYSYGVFYILKSPDTNEYTYGYVSPVIENNSIVKSQLSMTGLVVKDENTDEAAQYAGAVISYSTLDECYNDLMKFHVSENEKLIEVNN
ncbi:MAG: hypothetical protein Q4F95_02080 [Oscillospiraceae bacterium]|nr:hypothetical protein [Oscillospiraceae bacterium]